MKTNEITAAILTVKSMDELKQINEALSYQWKKVTAANAKSFRVNQKVQWACKNGQTMTGVVAKVNQKTVQVKTPMGIWRVSPGLLSKVA